MNLVFRDYAQPGDQMTLTFDTATKKKAQLQHQSRLTQNLGEEDPSEAFHAERNVETRPACNL